VNGLILVGIGTLKIIKLGFSGRVTTLAEGCFYKLFFRLKYTVAALKEILNN
jgi:hypothetical protein